MNFTESNLFLLFSSLSLPERKDMSKVLHSPFFNYREEEIKLFDYLLQSSLPAATPPTAIGAYKYIFAMHPNDMAKLRHVMTYLTRLINRYITISEMEDSDESAQLLLMRAMRKRNLHKQFLSGYKNTKHLFENQALLSPELYYQQFLLNTEYYAYSITNKRAEGGELQQLADDLDSFYIIQKLKHASSILSYKGIFKAKQEDTPLNEIMALVAKKQLLRNPLVNLLYHNYLCLSEPENESYFVKLKHLLLTESGRIEVQELRDIFTLAINYCIKRLNTGGQKYHQEVFEIYQAGLARNVFENNGQLSPFTYKNISAIAIGLKYFEWVIGFLASYKEKLAPDVRDGFYAFCMARYLFALGKYAQASSLLQQVTIREQFTDMDARVLLIKTYYELDEFGLLDYSIDNLKQQLQRKNLQSYHRDVYGNFVKYISRLIHLRTYDQKAQAAIAGRLSAVSAIAEKEWLLSKISPGTS